MLIQHHRHPHAYDKLDGHSHHCKHRGVVERGRKLRPGDHIVKIRQANEAAHVPNGFFKKTQPDGIEKRIDYQPNQNEHGRD
jgi:hypothetical protein